MAPADKKIIILAGPNGAGKTTFAREFLPNEARCPTFVNADLIAAGLSPFQPETVAVRAGRLMIELVHEHSNRGLSFAFETTLGTLSYARWIPRWQRDGYSVVLIFLSLSAVELALARVAQRVQQGGHSIPEDVIRRRFDAGRRNLENVYEGLVNAWALYDTSGEVPRVLDGSKRTPSSIEEAEAPDLALSLPAMMRARRGAEELASRTNTALVQVSAQRQQRTPSE